MTLGKIFGILIFSSLVATGATLAEDISKNLTNPSVQLGRKPTLTHHQGDACARGGVLAGHIVGKNPGKVMA